MRTRTFAVRLLTWIIAVIFMIPAGVPAQDTGAPDDPTRFSKEELTQLLAPIALYPDSLTAQILMAATYPLEIVEAERWLRNNSALKGKELDNALQEMSWDPSVKALSHFPGILNAMSDKLDQTRKLGDAFLRQEDDVMNTIQELRRKARDAGNLKATDKQTVIVEEEYIRIEPVDPEVVYVPVYDPLYVYGPWWYPAFPPYYWYYPTGVVSGAYIGFGPGIYLGYNLFSWVWFDWPVRRIHVDIDRTTRFHRHSRHDFRQQYWRHNPYHRRGVAYRDRRTSERLGVRPPRALPATPETRGFPAQRRERPTQPAIDRQRRGTPQPDRLERQGRPSTDGTRVPTSPQGRTAPKFEPRDTPFRGVGEGSFERRAGERGGSSIRSREMRRPGTDFRGGGMRFRDGGGRGEGVRRERR